jgi:hypothetical protein
MEEIKNEEDGNCQQFYCGNFLQEDNSQFYTSHQQLEIDQITISNNFEYEQQNLAEINFIGKKKKKMPKTKKKEKVELAKGQPKQNKKTIIDKNKDGEEKEKMAKFGRKL